MTVRLSRLQTSTAGGATTNLLFAGDAVVGEYDASGNIPRRYVPGPGSDQPVVWCEGAGTATREWLMTDTQGSIIGTADAGGNSQAIYAYDPYGQPNSWSGARYRYTGQLMIPEANLYYDKARMYDPAHGRFLQTDPVGYAGGINLYAYAGNDPRNGSDPSGLGAPSVQEVVVDGRPQSDFGFGGDFLIASYSIGSEPSETIDGVTRVAAVTVSARRSARGGIGGALARNNQSSQSKEQICKIKVGVTLGLDFAGVVGSLLPGENLAFAGANLALDTASIVNSAVQGSPEGVVFGAVGYHISAFGPAAATLGKGFAESLPVVGTVFAVGVLAYDGSQARKAYDDCVKGR